MNTRVRFRALVLLVAAVLPGCAGYDRLEPPSVDLRGVDPVKHNQDAADCTDRKRQASFVGSARIITDCMEEKGYTIITPRG
jgi:hypothetical protein